MTVKRPLLADCSVGLRALRDPHIPATPQRAKLEKNPSFCLTEEQLSPSARLCTWARTAMLSWARQVCLTLCPHHARMIFPWIVYVMVWVVMRGLYWNGNGPTLRRGTSSAVAGQTPPALGMPNTYNSRSLGKFSSDPYLISIAVTARAPASAHHLLPGVERRVTGWRASP